MTKANNGKQQFFKNVFSFFGSPKEKKGNNKHFMLKIFI